jgi:hypothetical protein
MNHCLQLTVAKDEPTVRSHGELHPVWAAYQSGSLEILNDVDVESISTVASGVTDRCPVSASDAAMASKYTFVLQEKTSR